MRRPTDAPHRVVIVGGGYGGLSAARALRRAPVDVALVDRADHHLVQPLLSRLATGALTDREVALPLHGILRRQRNARLVHAEVSEIDLGARRLEPLGLEYDSLIVAAGTTHPHRGEEDGAHLAPGLKSLADAREIRARVTGDRRVAIVGGGPTGIQLAEALARRASVTLLEVGPELLPHFPARASPRRRPAAARRRRPARRSRSGRGSRRDRPRRRRPRRRLPRSHAADARRGVRDRRHRGGRSGHRCGGDAAGPPRRADHPRPPRRRRTPVHCALTVLSRPARTTHPSPSDSKDFLPMRRLRTTSTRRLYGLVAVVALLAATGGSPRPRSAARRPPPTRSRSTARCSTR